MSLPVVDLVLVFAVGKAAHEKASKEEVRAEAQAAKAEYTRLTNTLTSAGLKTTGRTGVSAGQLLILVQAPWGKVQELVQHERHSDFLLGLPTSSVPSHLRDFQSHPLGAAERIRLVHDYITSLTSEGGLGVVPGSHQWPHLESVMALHNNIFNDHWMQSWTSRRMKLGAAYSELTTIKEQFGEEVALYFAFLSSYTRWLVFPSALGVYFFLKGQAYSPIYSTIVVIWSASFVEWWKIREKVLSIRWGSHGSYRSEKRRPEFRTCDQVQDPSAEDNFPWWLREARILASVPLILLYAVILIALLTGIFLLEAFVSQLYSGPGRRYVSFSPTVLFVALVPRLLALYHGSASRLTNWENHAHRSSHEYSLTIKTFALSALVAYLGLALSAFVYMPFYAQTIGFVRSLIVGSQTLMEVEHGQFFAAGAKPNANRLQDQMFAFTVTNQIIGFATEVLLPFVMRKATSIKDNGLGSSKKKRVGFSDTGIEDKGEREYIENIRHQVALPEYTLFSDYSEMVTQFGYVAAWSTIWPLASISALVNNWFEMPGDAFKIIRHCRRPMPRRADTIGPWVETLGFLTWLAALTNSALVYLFEPKATSATSMLGTQKVGTVLDDEFTNPAVNMTAAGSSRASQAFPLQTNALMVALLIALSSSHAYLLMRLLVRHILLRLCWKGKAEERLAQNSDREVKRLYLRTMTLNTPAIMRGEPEAASNEDAFWERDDGLQELSDLSKME